MAESKTAGAGEFNRSSSYESIDGQATVNVAFTLAIEKRKDQ